MAKVFISYRRTDSQHAVDRLYAGLAKHMAEPRRDIFTDVDNIPLGVDFEEHLSAKVGECETVLCVIGSGWLTEIQRRADDPKDFVRVEIEAALQRGIPVVPVLLDGAPVPSEDELPPTISALSRRNGTELRRATFDVNVETLAAGLGLVAATVGKAETEQAPDLGELTKIWAAISNSSSGEQVTAFLEEVRGTVLEASVQQRLNEIEHNHREIVHRALDLSLAAPKSARRRTYKLLIGAVLAALVVSIGSVFGIMLLKNRSIEASSSETSDDLPSESATAPFAQFGEARVPIGDLVGAREIKTLPVANNCDVTPDSPYHGCAVYAAAFSPDGRFVVTGGADYSARIWEVETGQLRNTLEDHERYVNDVAFSPDANLIVTASSDFTAKIWEVDTGQLRQTLAGHGYFVNSAAFSPDGRYVVTGSSDNTAKLWETISGRLVRTYGGRQSDGPANPDDGNRVYAVAFSPDGRFILTGTDAVATGKIWDIETGLVVRSLEGAYGAIFHSAAYSLDGKLIVTGSTDGQATIWDADTGQLLHTLDVVPGFRVNSTVFSPDGRFVLTASVGGIAKIWDVETGVLVVALQGHEGEVTTAVFSSDGRLVVTGSRDGSAKIWALEFAN